MSRLRMPRRRQLRSTRDARVRQFETLEARQVLAAQPIISEFLASNDNSLLDEDNRSTDWIELTNVGDAAIDLAGWHLTDNPANLDKWTFPSTPLAPGQYLIVFASGKDRAVSGQQLHTDFELSDNGDYLALVAPDGATIVSEFGSATTEYPEQLSDISYGVRDTGSAPIALVSSSASTSYLVPTDGSLGPTWTSPGFDDSAWSSGPGPIGYDHSSPSSGGVSALSGYSWSVLRDNPRFYWNFDEANGPARDLVRGQANDQLEPSAAATRVAHSAIGSPLRLGRAANLDGASSFTATNLGDVQMPGAWAVEFWMQAQGAQVTPAGSSGSRNDYLMNFGGDGAAGGENPSVQFDQSAAGADNKVELVRSVRTGVNGPSVNDTNWHHVVLVFYGNGTSIGVANRTDVVIDGVVSANITDANFSSNLTLGGALVVGARFANGTSGFEGRIDELALYDLSGLAVAEVTAKVTTLAGHFALASTADVASALQCVSPASYTYSAAPGGSAAYEDAARTKLNDRIIGSTASSNVASGQWAGWNTTDPVITFDLGESYDLSTATIDFAVQHSAGVHAPDSVMIEFSADGVSYGSPVSSTAINDFVGVSSIGWDRRAVVNVSGRTARYVRMTFANTDEWTFLGEVRFAGSQTGESGRGCALPATPPVDLVGYWDFNDRTTDLSGQGNTASLEGATYTTDTPAVLGGGKAVNFNATSGQFVEVPDSPELRLGGAFTISAWMKSTNLNQSQVYLISRNTAYANPYGSPSKQYAVIYEYVDNRVEFFGPSLASGSDPRAGSQLTVADANWHHVAYTSDGQTWSGYVDGVRVFSVARPFALDATFASSWFFGTANPDVGFYSGMLDDIAMWNGALPSAQVAALAAGSSPLSLGGYGNLIATDVESSLYEHHSTLYTRHEFNVADPAAITQLALNTKYDDGFVAYLNGVKVAEDNAPATPQWDSTATADRPDAQAIVDRAFDLTSFRNALVAGTNVLAIVGLNTSAGDDDFLLSAELTAQTSLQLLHQNAFFTTPTPGSANGSGTGAPGPQLSDVSEPTGAIADSDNLVVTAKVTTSLAPAASVSLFYRANYGAELSLPMLDDGTGSDAMAGDGIYTAVIPAAAASPGQMLRYYVRAVDTAGRAERYPRFLDPTGSPEYLGTVVADPNVTSELPVYQWFIAPGTQGAADTRSGTRASVFYLNQFYDNVLVRLRGRSINSTGKLAYKFDFNQHHHFQYDVDQPRVEELDLGSTGLDKSYVRPIIGFELFRDSGAEYSTTFPMRVQQNGLFFSVAWFIENPDEDYLARNRLDPNGAFYKANLNGFTTLAQGGYRNVTEGFDKKTREWEDKSDIVAFTAGVELSGQALANFLFDNVDIAMQINYMAAETLVQDADRLVNNFYVYRDTEGDGLWHMIVWDLDLALGQFEVGSDVIHADDDYPAGVSHPFHGIQTKPDFRNPSLWNNLLTKIIATPSTREMFLRRLRTLMDDFLKPTGTPAADLYFETRMDELFAEMSADVTLDKAKWGNRYGAAETFLQSLNRLKNEYFAVRRTHLFQTHSIDNLSGGANTTLISGTPGETVASYFVPADNSLGTTWTSLAFTPSTPWATGATGIGYENAPENYASLLQTSVKPQNTCATCSSVFVRVPFNVTDAEAISQLTLQMKYDDGFVAYLNGQEVARRNVTGTPGFDAAATDHTDSLAVNYENIAIAASALVDGANVLAIHVINSSVASSDLLVLPQLITGVPPTGDVAGIPHAQVGNPTINFGQIEFNPASGNQDEEFIALANPNATAVDISGWKLAGGIDHTFKPGTVIPAGGTLYVTPNFSAFRARTTGPRGGQGLFVQGNYSGHLSNFGETIDLVAADDSIVATTTTPSIPSDVQQFLRITEIMYHPADPTPAELAAGYDDGEFFEFIELRNTSGATTLHLDNVQFTGGISFTFGDVDLPPGGYVVLASNPAAFAARYGADVGLAGQYTGNLSNGGESIKLDDEDGSSIHDFTYDDNGPTWHPSTDGAGPSLVIVDEYGALENWNDGSHWRPSVALQGSPGAADRLPGDANGDGSVDLVDLAILQSYFGTPSGATQNEGDFDGDGAVGRSDAAILGWNFGRSYNAPTSGGSAAPPPAAAILAHASATRRTVRAAAAHVGRENEISPDLSPTTMLRASRLRATAVDRVLSRISSNREG